MSESQNSPPTVEEPKPVINNNQKPLESKWKIANYGVCFMNKIIKMGNEGPMEFENLYMPPNEIIFSKNFFSFNESWNKLKRKKKNPNILLAVFYQIWYYMLQGLVITFVNFGFQAINPKIMYYLLDWYKDPNRDMATGFVFIAIFQFTIWFTFIFNLINRYYMQRAGPRISNCMFGVVYDKIFRVAPEAKYFINQGKITTILTEDISNVSGIYSSIFTIIITPIQLVTYSCMIIYELKWIAAIVPFVSLTAMFIEYHISLFQMKLYEKKFALSDERNMLVSEAVSNMKVIKLEALEDVKSNAIYDVRLKEIKTVITWFYTEAASSIVSGHVIDITVLIAFPIYNSYVAPLTVATVYMLYQLFSINTFFKYKLIKIFIYFYSKRAEDFSKKHLLKKFNGSKIYFIFKKF